MPFSFARGRLIASILSLVTAGPLHAQSSLGLPSTPEPAAPPTELPTLRPDVAVDAKADAVPKTDVAKALSDSLNPNEDYGLKSLFDSLNPRDRTGKKWYEKLSLRGYSQFRFARTLDQAAGSAEPNLLADRSVNGVAENFSIRRNRLIL